ncbi:MAG TPA: glycosyltransferase family 4 protein [Gemmataceae bacterium]|jgi:glycosyltransferase involved in cell wall biosynthesis|nr:glycosyltransferase family 4 protein [Gemmataceae bacterium]
MRRPHIAVLDEELPYPLTSGKRIRTLNLLRHLARRYRITYLARRNDDVDEVAAASELFKSLDITPVIAAPPVPAKAGFRFYGRLAANLVAPVPYSVATHAGQDFRQAVNDFAARDPVDLWHCEWTPYAAGLRDLRAADTGLRWLVMAHNVESLIWRRYAETERQPLKRWYIRRQWRKWERFERATAAAATCTVAVSPDDARLFHCDFAAQRVAVVDNGVDTTFFRPTPEVPRDPCRVIFVGSLDWRPNLDAVDILLNEIWPKVAHARPVAKLTIVGRKPPEALRRDIAGRPGVELHADVPDVRPHLAGSGLLAVPLRVGGGSRLKILEALATGLPVVSTRIGAEGLSLEPGGHLDVVADVDGMADAILAAMNDPRRAQAQADAGRRRVLERYDWRPLAEKLAAVWDDCLGKGDVARAA